MYHRLLVPLDGSHLAESVLPAVVALGNCGASVVLLHILERGAPAEIHGERHLTSAAEGDGYLEEIAAELRQHGISVEYHSHPAPEGDVARSIAQHAEEVGADLVVLCTHGGSGVRHLLSGSIAQQVLNHGAQPVLLIRPGGPATFHPRVVVAALDGTAAAETALGPAAAIAREHGATLRLVLVVPTNRPRPETTLLPLASRAVLELEEEQAQEYLRGLAAAWQAPDLPVSVEVRRGEPTAQLADEAGRPEVGLVVVATHGRAGLQAIWAGSVANRLLGKTRAPVLLLRRVER